MEINELKEDIRHIHEHLLDVDSRAGRQQTQINLLVQLLQPQQTNPLRDIQDQLNQLQRDCMLKQDCKLK